MKNKYGFEIIKLVKDFLADGGNRDSFMALEEDFDNDFSQLFSTSKRNKHSFRSTIYTRKDETSTSHSLWNDLAARSSGKNQITMVGFSSTQRGKDYSLKGGVEPVRIRPSGKIHNRSEKKCKIGCSPYKEVIAGFVIFKVGGEEGWANPSGKGWHGQQYYTKTTMCEDNVWSYNWSCNKTLGDVGEIRCVTMQGQGDKTDSITRKKNVDLSDKNKYSDCALKEMLDALSSESYKIEDSHVVMRWSKPCGRHIKLDMQKKKPRTPFDYREMAEYLVGLSDECEYRGIMGRGDKEEPELMQKVQDICDMLKAGGITTHSSSISTPRISPKLKRPTRKRMTTHKRVSKQKHKRAAKQIRYPFKDCKEGYVYSDQDGDNIYYLSDERVDVYDSFFVPLDNNFMTRQQFASVNKDAILSEIGQYSEKDVYHEPKRDDNIRYLFEDDDGNNWYKGVIIRVDSGEYTVKYDSDAGRTPHPKGAFSKDNFNKHWKFSK